MDTEGVNEAATVGSEYSNLREPFATATTLIAETGIRRNEYDDLDGSELDRDARALVVRTRGKSKSTPATRTIPLAAELFDRVVERGQLRGPLFMYQGRPLTSQRLREEWEAVATFDDVERITFADLRRQRIGRWVAEGVRPRTLAELGGYSPHQLDQLVRRYTQGQN